MAGHPRSWTRRLFERTRLPTFGAGLALLLLLLGGFTTQELILGRFALARESIVIAEDMWIAIVHVVIAAYLVTACVYCEQTRDTTLEELRPLLDEAGAEGALARAAGERRILLGAGLVGILLAFLISIYLAPEANYDPKSFNPENIWHRVLGLVLGFWITRLLLFITIESGRVSQLAGSLREIDLLDLGELRVFARQGLTSALLVIGSVSVFALFLVDLRYVGMVALLLVVASTVGTLALLLPLRGVRERIRAAKQQELAWCRDRMRRARDGLASGDGEDNGKLDELVAWEARIASVNEWAIDASTFVRFALYLLIPLGSWAGGALVERLVDTVLG